MTTPDIHDKNNGPFMVEVYAHVGIGVLGSDKYGFAWRPVRPTGGKPYRFETYAAAHKSLAYQGYAHALQGDTVRIRPA